MIQLCQRKAVGGKVSNMGRSDLYELLERFVEPDLAEPGVGDTAAEVNAGARPMLLRPQMASFHQRLELMQDIQEAHAGPKKIQGLIEDEDEDDLDGSGMSKEKLVQVRHRSRIQKLFDVLVCRRRAGGGAFFGLFPAADKQ